MLSSFVHLVSVALAHVELSAQTQLIFALLLINQFTHILFLDNRLKKPKKDLVFIFCSLKILEL